MKTFWKYLRAAVGYQPTRILPPVSWLLLAVCALGFFGVGFLIVGLGLEASYLFLVSTSERFRRYIDGMELINQRQDVQKQLQDILKELPPSFAARYQRLANTCQQIVEESRKDLQGSGAVSVDDSGITKSLGHLAWIYLKLLRAYYGLQSVLEKIAAEAKTPLDARITAMEGQLADKTLTQEVRGSLTAQLDLMKKRHETQVQARDKLRYLDAELGRIEEQVELVREQAALTTEPSVVSTKVDSISATLEGTNNWIMEQQRVLGDWNEDLQEPPALFAPQAAKEKQ